MSDSRPLKLPSCPVHILPQSWGGPGICICPILGLLCTFLNSSCLTDHGLHEPDGVLIACSFLKASFSCSLPLPSPGLCPRGCFQHADNARGREYFSGPGVSHSGLSGSVTRVCCQVPFLHLSVLICRIETRVPISQDCIRIIILINIRGSLNLSCLTHTKVYILPYKV